MANENIEVGTRAVAKVGRNEISVEVIAVENGKFPCPQRCRTGISCGAFDCTADAK